MYPQVQPARAPAAVSRKPLRGTDAKARGWRITAVPADPDDPQARMDEDDLPAFR